MKSNDKQTDSSVLPPNRKGSSVVTTALITIILFYGWSIFHAFFIFKQFTFLEIFSVSVFFLLLLTMLSVLFMRDIFRQVNFKIPLTHALLIIATLVFIVLLANSLSEHYLNYYRPLPYLEIELGLGWHKDTAFHVSIIQNILNFGYPSIGQHDTPIIFYHVLSHYIDALGVLLTGLDPYDSYTLFFHFKVFLFISSIMLLVSTTLKSTKPTIAIFAFLVLVPVAISYWYPIGSEGLWFISVVTIFGIPKVFSIMTKDSNIENKDYFYIFILILIISLGKVSSGFMFAAFIGVFLWLSNFKDYRVYLLGIFWAAFFLIFLNLMSGSEGSSSLSVPNFFDIESISDRIKIYSKFTGIQVLQVFIATCVLFSLSFLYKNKKTYLTAISTLAGILVFFIITQLYAGFNRGMVLYFSFGLSYIITLFTFLFIANHLNNDSSIYLDKDNQSKNTRKIFFVLIITGFTFFFAKPSSNLFNINFTQIYKIINNINHLSYKRINTTLAKDEKLSFKRLLLGEVEFDIPIKPSTSLATFKRDLETYAQNNRLSKKDSLVFIPKNIFESNITELKGTTWASGMLMYASTGFPLLHGIQQTLRNDHGHSDYDKKAVWKDQKEFDHQVSNTFSKNIIVVNSFAPARFSHIDYKKSFNTPEKTNSVKL